MTVTALVPLKAKLLATQLEMERLEAMLQDAWMRGDMVKRAMLDGRTRGMARDIYFFLLWDLSFEEWRPVKMLQVIRGVGRQLGRKVSRASILGGQKVLLDGGYLEKRSQAPNLPNEYRLLVPGGGAARVPVSQPTPAEGSRIQLLSDGDLVRLWGNTLSVKAFDRKRFESIVAGLRLPSDQPPQQEKAS